MVDFANKSILSMAHLNICFYHTSVIFSMILACSSHSFGIALCNTQPTLIYFKTVCSGAITLFVSGNTMYACIYIYFFFFFSRSLCVCVFFLFLPVCRVWTLSPTSCVLMLFINLYLLLLLLSPFYHTHFQRYLWKHMQIRTHTHIHQHPN